MDKKVPKCPKGMKKFNRHAVVCTECRLNSPINRLGHYECPFGLEGMDYYIDSEEEGGDS